MELSGLPEKVIRRFREVKAHRSIMRLRKKTNPILLDSSLPDTSNSERQFDQLQNAFPPHNNAKYAYDPFSTWRRGVERSSTIVELTGKHNPGLRILEVGCGDAMTGCLLSSYGHDVTLTDMEDWRDERSRSMPMVIGKLESGLLLESNQFDVVFSYNTFEHLEDPAIALAELIRVCQEQGFILLDFGPLYSSPWGLHAYRMLRMPYPQFLFSEGFIEERLKVLGIQDLGKYQNSLQPLNKWNIDKFDKLWANSGCEIVDYETRIKDQYIYMVNRFHRAFSGRGLTIADLTTSAIRIVLRKY